MSKEKINSDLLNKRNKKVIIHDTIYSNNKVFNNNYKGKTETNFPDDYGRPDKSLVEWAFNQTQTTYTLDEVQRIFNYFFFKFYQSKNKKHPYVSGWKFKGFIEDLDCCFDHSGNFIAIEFFEYEAIIDYYFENLHKFKGNAYGECDHSIFHFMSVRENCHWATIRNFGLDD